MEDKRVFFASSMLENEIRSYTSDVIQIINTHINKNKINYIADIFGQNYTGEGFLNSQDSIDERVKECEIFIMLFRTTNKIGEITLNEFKQALNTPIKPKFKLLCLDDTSSAAEYKARITEYEAVVNEAVREVLLEDNRIYIERCESKQKLKDNIVGFLNREAYKTKYYFQEELGYKSIQEKATHFNHRLGEDKVKYFRRPIDSEIEKLINNKDYSISIIKGNTLTGKTRSAVELMKTRQEWKDSKFYIFNNKNQLDALRSFDLYDEKPYVVLIDDINLLIEDDYTALGRFRNFMNAVNNGQNVENKLHLIIVVTERNGEDYNQYFERILGSDYHHGYINDNCIVNFNDYTDAKKQRELVSALRAEGYTFNYSDRLLGNFAIGSLFYNTQSIEKNIRQALTTYPSIRYLFYAIKCQRLYMRHSFGNYNELESFYAYLIESHNVPDFGKINNVGFKWYIGYLNSLGLIECRMHNIIDSSSSISIDTFLVDYHFCNKNGDANDTNIDKKEAIKDILGYTKKCKDQNSYYDTAASLMLRGDLESKELRFLVKTVFDVVFTKQELRVIKEEGCILAPFEKYRSNLSDKERFFCSSFIGKHPARDVVIRNRNLVKGNKTLFLAATEGLLHRQDLTDNILEDIVKSIFTIESGILRFEAPFEESDLYDPKLLRSVVRYLPTDIALDFVDNMASNSVDDDYCGWEDDGDDDAIECDDDMTYSNEYSSFGVVVELFKKAKDYIEFNKIYRFIRPIIGSTQNNISRINLLNSPEFISYFLKSVCKFEILNNPSSIAQFMRILTTLDDVRICRDEFTITMSKFLLLLNKSDAEWLFDFLIKNRFYNSYTLSYLAQNPNMFVEDLLPLFNKATEEDLKNESSIKSGGVSSKKMIHLITLNQLLYKAQTYSDANQCLSLLYKNGYIQENSTDYIKDESTFASYIKSFENEDIEKVVELLKRFYVKERRADERLLRNDTISILINIMSFDQVDDMISSSSSLSNDQYFDKWGITLGELELRVKYNPIILNKWIKKGSHKHRARLFDWLERFVVSDDRAREIVYGAKNNNYTIISAFLNVCCSSYEKASDILNRYNINRVDSRYIARTLAKIVRGDNSIDVDSKINIINDIMVENSTKLSTEVVSKIYYIEAMVGLIYERIAFLTYNDFKVVQKFALPQSGSKVYVVQNITLLEYVDLLVVANKKYIDSKIIYYLLDILKYAPDELEWNNLWIHIKKIAQLCQTTIDIKGAFALSRQTCRPLVTVENSKINFLGNKDLISAFSQIKTLCYLMTKQQFRYEDAEKYIEKHAISRTQTYWNIMFETILKDSNKLKDEKLRLMCTILDNNFNSDHNIKRDVRMAVAMVKLAGDLDEAETLYSDYFKERVNITPEILDLMLQKLRNDYLSAQKLIHDNLESVNTYNITTYISMIRKSDTEESNDIIKRCWEVLKHRGAHIPLDIIGIENSEGKIAPLLPDARTYSNFMSIKSCENEGVHPFITIIDDNLVDSFEYDLNKASIYDYIRNIIYYHNNFSSRTEYNRFYHILNQNIYNNDRVKLLENLKNRKGNIKGLDFYIRTIINTPSLLKMVLTNGYWLLWESKSVIFSRLKEYVQKSTNRTCLLSVIAEVDSYYEDLYLDRGIDKNYKVFISIRELLMVSE